MPYLGNPNIPNALPLQGITSLDGPGSEGLTRRQVYSVTEIRGHRRTELFGGKTLVAVPSNAGSATMPNYEALAAQGIYSGQVRRRHGGCARVRRTTRGDVLHRPRRSVRHPQPAPLPAVAHARPRTRTTFKNPFGINRFANTNINTIAIEVPIKCVTSDAKPLGRLPTR